MDRNYKISIKPIGDEKKWGILAHVDDKTREKILNVGEGEVQSHIDFITSVIGERKKMIKKSPHLQATFDI